MHILYLDDSGSPINPNEEYFILGGVCIPEKSIRWLSYQLDKLASTINPTAPETVEFHAAEIFSGKTPPWNKITDKKDRVRIIQNVLGVLEKAHSEIVLFACAIHKKSYPNDDPVLMAYEELANRFHAHLERDIGQEETGLIIIDKTSYETGLQNLAKSFRKSGTKWGSQLRSIVEVPLFVDSAASRITQFADHIAYSVFRRYNANDLTYFNCIENRFFQKNNIIHGLVHRQLNNRDCTCPACITRRKSDG